MGVLKKVETIGEWVTAGLIVWIVWQILGVIIGIGLIGLFFLVGLIVAGGG